MPIKGPLNYHFQHFDMFSGRLYEIPSDRKDYQLFSLFSEFNDKSGESDKKIGRAGDNTTNRKTLDEIVRVVMSICSSELDAESDRFEDMIW